MRENDYRQCVEAIVVAREFYPKELVGKKYVREERVFRYIRIR